MQFGPVQIGAWAVLTVLLITTAVLDRLGINPVEALYLLTFAGVSIGYLMYERRGTQRQ